MLNKSFIAGNCLTAVVLATGADMDIEKHLSMDLFEMVPRKSYEAESNRLKLRSENKSLSIKKFVADYVSEIERGNLYMLGNSLLYAESLEDRKRSLGQQTDFINDLCFIELALAKYKVSTNNYKDARVFLQDSSRLLSLTKVSGKDSQYARTQLRELTKVVESKRVRESEKGELSPAFSKE